jgi:hypothetical protein
VEFCLHVSSSKNRESTERHGLDWNRMGAAPGIAGSLRPEVDGAFLCCEDGDHRFFVELNNTGGPVDVWEVSGVSETELDESSNGFCYVARVVPPRDLRLVRRDVGA